MESHNSLLRPGESEDKQAEKKVVPKFASFRLKDTFSQSLGPNHVVEPKNHMQSRQSSDASTVWSHRELKRGRAYGPYKSAQEGSQEKHDDGVWGKLPRSSGSGIILSENSSDLYIIDKNGDQNNLTFGSLDRYKIPVYSRWGAGNLIGLPRWHKIHRSPLHDQAIIITLQDKNTNFLGESNTLRTTKPARGREFMVKYRANEEDSILGEADYVSVGKSKPAKRRRNDRDSSTASLSQEDDHNQSSSIGWSLGFQNDSADDDLESLDDQNDSKLHVSNNSRDLASRLGYLNRKVDSNPTDVETWLSLISFQDKAIGLDGSIVKRKAAEKKSIADIKISMYEKALTHVQTPLARERLLIGMMQEAATIWDSASLSAKWGYLLRKHPTYLDLSIQHLDFLQSDFLSFTYNAVRKHFLDCLEGLKQHLRELSHNTEEHVKLYKTYIHVFLRLSLFATESGFTEYATAAWQAILELQIFRPPNTLGLDRNGEMNAEWELFTDLEKFWDSEVPRIGERGSAGWRHSDARGNAAIEARVKFADKPSNKQDGVDLWLALEHYYNGMSCEVARTTDGLEEDDPYKVVLYTDLEPLLFLSFSPEIWQPLLGAFLTFCQLPPYQGFPTFSLNNWWTNGLVHDQIPYLNEGGTDQFDIYAQDYQVDQDAMFPQAGEWFSAFSRYQDRCINERIKTDWVLRVVRMLTDIGVGGDVFAEYCLAFELAISPDTARKTAKRLLKKRPSNLRLYNAFAILECRLGNIGKLENVIVTTLRMSKQLDSTAQRDTILLWRTLVWELVKSGKHAKAVARLISFPEGAELQDLEVDASKRSVPQAALMLRAEVSLSAERDHHLSQCMSQLAVAAAHCLFLLAYLRDPNSLVAAHRVFRSNLEAFSKLPSHEASQEQVHQCFAHLVYYHTTHKSQFKPSEVRSFLAESIAAFPHNTIFLCLYASNEARFHIEDRVRSVVRDVLSADSSKCPVKKSLAPYFFAIRAELARDVRFGSNTHAIRGAFEHAIESDAAAHCPGLWKMYFLFEKSRGNMREAKAVFYRSIRACPWVKSLYLLAFEHLRGVEKGMSETELKGVYDLMCEKELRLHADLHEVMESREQ